MEECTIVMQCLQPRHPEEKVQETLTPPPQVIKQKIYLSFSTFIACSAHFVSFNPTARR